MPAPERAWLTSDSIADIITDLLRERFGEVQGMNRGQVQRVVREAYEATGYTYEFKILRLLEKVKDAIIAGAFGPLAIPNTLNADGEKILTPVGEIATLLRDCYTPEVLDQFDEDGEPRYWPADAPAG